jgi:hypothetical protein
MPTVTNYEPPEEAFEVRYQCTEEEILKHCNAARGNDRRDFDNKGGLQITIYHCYRDGSLDEKMKYWYTTDEKERDECEFDIRIISKCSDDIWSDYEDDHQAALQKALDEGYVYFGWNEIITRDEDEAEEYRETIANDKARTISDKIIHAQQVSLGTLDAQYPTR